MATAAAALAIANSPGAGAYTGALATYLGPLTLIHWINDGLMAIFFLFVGLEIKREVLQGELSTWSQRVLPGVAAIGGIVVPALVFLAFNWGNPVTTRGWAIPAATDIAFALGVLALLGSRIPTSLKVFLTALAIIDDLCAVLIIALFYTASISWLDLAAAGLVLAALVGLNRAGVVRLLPYLLLGAVLWTLVLRSGVHATLAGVSLAFTIPLRTGNAAAEPPLLRLEHGMYKWVMLGVVPVFGFANAGVSLAGIGSDVLTGPLTLGVVAGLFIGKLVGVFGTVAVVLGFGLARKPEGATWLHLLGTSILCGIGFTMSLFIGSLAFAGSPALADEVKIGILAGSLIAGTAGWLVLRLAPESQHAHASPTERSYAGSGQHR